MRLFTGPMVPNPLRVVMLMREKRLDIPLVDVDLRSIEKKLAYRAINPLAQVPALELDDGTYICESRMVNGRNTACSSTPYPKNQ